MCPTVLIHSIECHVWHQTDFLIKYVVTRGINHLHDCGGCKCTNCNEKLFKIQSWFQIQKGGTCPLTTSRSTLCWLLHNQYFFRFFYTANVADAFIMKHVPQDLLKLFSLHIISINSSNYKNENANIDWNKTKLVNYFCKSILSDFQMWVIPVPFNHFIAIFMRHSVDVTHRVTGCFFAPHCLSQMSGWEQHE